MTDTNITRTDNSSEPDCSALELCQEAVSGILLTALGGNDKALRTTDGFVRWGLVEFRILETIKHHWPGAAASSDERSVSLRCVLDETFH